ncbi:hypothetical protein MAPG_06259 [Magnaporthiopsis poae ATCC 64411]|uniref:Uncharacterized protein n=1 Tax=Magnaporthiopsis poae (strain ATCC 64411 / 73-15) TaxID=644358 RepID=A0A0C4E1J5_MAGP6|nr:hypothetical protein MAPG_06259 [Magnaporthiopsis poae ATCC 64411]
MAKKRSDRGKKPGPPIPESPAQYMSRVSKRKPETKMEKKMRRRYLKERQAELDAADKRWADAGEWAKDVLEADAQKKAKKLATDKPSGQTQPSGAAAGEQAEVASSASLLSMAEAEDTEAESGGGPADSKAPKKLRPSQHIQLQNRKIGRLRVLVAGQQNKIDRICKDAEDFADGVKRQLEEMQQTIRQLLRL